MTNSRKLKKIYLSFCDYGENKGQYTGNVEFENGEYNLFRYNIDSDIANRYIQLISEDVVKSASLLGNRLKESLINQGLYINK